MLPRCFSLLVYARSIKGKELSKLFVVECFGLLFILIAPKREVEKLVRLT